MLPARARPWYQAAVRSAVLVVALSIAGSAVSTEARADFKEWSLSLTPGFAMMYVDSRSAPGGGGGLDVGFGVSESLTLHASGFVSWHSMDPSMSLMKPGGTVSAFAAMVGLSYALDVIRLVPAFDVSLGALGVRPGAGFSGDAKLLSPSTDFAIALGFTCDWLFTRHLALGVQLRYYAVVTDLSRLPAYFFVGPRLTFRFGG